MKKIKNAFGRFYLNHPKTASAFQWIAFSLAMFFIFNAFLAVWMHDHHYWSGYLSTIFSGGFLLFIVLSSHLSASRNYAKKMPEYFISEAEKILESKVVSPKLESLMEQVKTNKGENGLNGLKNWLKLFRDYKSLEENLPQLREQQDEITTKISKSMEKRNELRMDLLIL